MTQHDGPWALILDIETAPLLGYVWGLWENNVALNQIHTDWYMLSWAAKWLHDKPNRVMYRDQRNEPNIEDDKTLVTCLWHLLDQADIVITQNGKSFDHKKINARFIAHGLKPPSSYRHIDTKIIAKKHFGFTSNKLEYMTGLLCKKYKKLKHEKFGGFELWKACLAGNIKAWKTMEKYNKYDVLSLEELYHKLAPWDNTINFNVYKRDWSTKCNCGKGLPKRNGFYYTDSAKFQRYRCTYCGAESRGKVNLLSKLQKATLKNRTSR